MHKLSLNKVGSTFLITTLALLAVTAAARADELSNYTDENGSLQARARVFAQGEKKIVLIPMIHISTRKFYRGVTRKLGEYNPAETVVLQEGVSICGPESDPFQRAWAPGEKFDANQAEELLARSAQGDTLSDDDITQAGFERHDCAEKHHVGFFQAIKQRFFSTYPLIATVFLLHSQYSLDYPKGLPRRDGDIIGTHLKTTRDQIVFNSLVACFNSYTAPGGDTGPDLCGRVVRWLKASDFAKPNEVIVELRNQVLFAKLFTTLGLPLDGELAEAAERYQITTDEIRAGSNTVVLPWGAEHFSTDDYAFPKALEDHGFRYSGASNIEVTQCSRTHRNPILSGLRASGSFDGACP